MSGEFPQQLDYTPCLKLFIKTSRFFFASFGHISSLRDVAIIREI